MNKNFKQIKEDIYDNCGLKLSHYQEEKESKEYEACTFQLNELKIISRSSKITPKKTGQFVTFWKRQGAGPIAPFDDTDSFDYFVVNVRTEVKLGQFVFPKSILIKKGIISTSKKEGKRAIRVYPSWDTPLNATAIRTQKWQLDYFVDLNNSSEIVILKSLYGITN
ncbi:MepB family protein [Nonlabens sp. Asnod2-A12]|uniref:MepB family protein n=1 Tax=Nonlabens sp. Asnod2-A12 TaxID=3160578 RepID=UPI00386D29E0